MLGRGLVRHTRLRPKHHAFSYTTFFLLLPMRSMESPASPGPGATALSRNQRGLLSFYDRDHGDGRENALHWLLALLAAEGVQDADGEIWLQTYPRVLGYAFKPVSFWYCHRADGSLRAVVVEVNNTFGERHFYVLDGQDVRWGATLVAHKAFHVSPFCAVEGVYRFRFMRTEGSIVARIEHDDNVGPLILTSLSGSLEPFSASLARRAFINTPLMTLGVVGRIHWHALKLWLKRVPFHRKPAPPQALVSR